MDEETGHKCADCECEGYETTASGDCGGANGDGMCGHAKDRHTRT